ncbi:MAG: dockerin type I repeat-containing protein [Armatimonadota bacterium]
MAGRKMRVFRTTVAAVLATAVMALSTQVRLSAAQLGDVNGDGKVNLADAVLAARLAVGAVESTPERVKAADVSPCPGSGAPIGDGKITIADATRLLRYVMGLISDLEFEPEPSTKAVLRIEQDALKAPSASKEPTKEIFVPVAADGVANAAAGSVTLCIKPIGVTSGPMPKIVGVEPGDALPEGTKIETNPEEIPAEGVSKVTAGFFLASGKLPNNSGVLFNFRVAVPRGIPANSRFILQLTNGDISTEESTQMLVVLNEGVLEITK